MYFDGSEDYGISGSIEVEHGFPVSNNVLAIGEGRVAIRYAADWKEFQKVAGFFPDARLYAYYEGQDLASLVSGKVGLQISLNHYASRLWEVFNESVNSMLKSAEAGGSPFPGLNDNPPMPPIHVTAIFDEGYVSDTGDHNIVLKKFSQNADRLIDYVLPKFPFK